MIKKTIEVCKILYSYELTERKFRKLLALAEFLRDCRNKVSEYVFEHLEELIGLNKFDFVKHMREHFHGLVDPAFDYQLISSVYVSYENRIKQVKNAITFESRIIKSVDYYKKKTKTHKKGDFKGYSYTITKSMLCITLTYLARYGCENTYDYICNKLNDPNIDKDYYDYISEIKRVCDKFGFEKLLTLALHKRQRIREKYNKKVIVYTSLTFSGRSRKKNILTRNSNHDSCIQTFVSLSGVRGSKTNTFYVPVDYNKHFYGNINIYNEKEYNFEYTITFDVYERRIKIHLCKQEERDFPTVVDETYQDCMGADANVKHNIFSLGDGHTIDFFDRSLITEWIKVQKEIDARKKANKGYKPGVKLQHKIDVLENKMLYHNTAQCVELCDYVLSKGSHHLVMENLDNSFDKTSSIYEDDGQSLNYNRINGFIGLSSLKGIVKRVGVKRGVILSLCHAAFTSQMCPKCGHIEKGNRKVQESFDCLGENCDFEGPADMVAGINIGNRVSVAVLRENLLKQLPDGSFEPIPMSVEEVRKIIMDIRDDYVKEISHRENSVGYQSVANATD